MEPWRQQRAGTDSRAACGAHLQCSAFLRSLPARTERWFWRCFFSSKVPPSVPQRGTWKWDCDGISRSNGADRKERQWKLLCGRDADAGCRQRIWAVRDHVDRWRLSPNLQLSWTWTHDYLEQCHPISRRKDGSIPLLVA